MSKEKNLAVVAHGPENYRLEEVDLPEVGNEEILLRVKAAGVCASDIKCYHGARRYWEGPPSPYVKAPFTPGHEFVGEVVDAGSAAKKKWEIKPGDKVVAEQILPCWKCKFCRSGRYWMCERNYVFGFHGGIDDGAWAEYMVFPAGSIVHKVPKEVPDKSGAMIEPLSCAIHAVERANIQFSDTVVISGTGSIGLCMLQIARLKSPQRIIALDAKDNRLKLAEELGADVTVNVTGEDPVKKVMDLTEGYGCDVYIEAAGHPESVKKGLQMVRKLGTYVEFGVFAEETSLDWSVVGDQKELDIRGSHLGPYCYPLAIDYLKEGKVKVDKIITHTFPLKKFEDALQLALRGENSIKILLIP